MPQYSFGPILAVTTAALISIAGCSKPAPAPSPQASASGQAAKITAASATDRRMQILAATETFENLTEGAFGKNEAAVDRLLTRARSNAEGVRSYLGPESQAALDRQLDAMANARKDNRPADLALASNEGYRLLVSLAGGETGVPVEVSLLDYSGFRISADLGASPARWEDIEMAERFAQGQWDEVRTRIHDRTVADDFAATLASLKVAIESRDQAETRRQALKELDQVDILEAQFG